MSVLFYSIKSYLCAEVWLYNNNLCKNNTILIYILNKPLFVTCFVYYYLYIAVDIWYEKNCTYLKIYKRYLFKKTCVHPTPFGPELCTLILSYKFGKQILSHEHEFLHFILSTFFSFFLLFGYFVIWNEIRLLLLISCYFFEFYIKKRVDNNVVFIPCSWLFFLFSFFSLHFWYTTKTNEK